uniref:Uncharacterized protein n=1 Tax=Utricularia reniformis TaxID=192314 RepID=A0A1Y0B2X8_9LAMI|nr:hypothetical protein AEK19_MT1611 [Utricularia reniformis]ART31796.1 hypothetical protein AEK19_MT1611 [Utricularia reniformis]
MQDSILFFFLNRLTVLTLFPVRLEGVGEELYYNIALAYQEWFLLCCYAVMRVVELSRVYG